MTEQSELLREFLAKPVGPVSAQKPSNRPLARPTASLNLRGETADVEVVTEVGDSPEGAARSVLTAQGQNPDAWTVTTFSASVWDGANGKKMQSNKFSFKYVGEAGPMISHEEIDELIKRAKRAPAHSVSKDEPESAFVVHITDEQLGRKDDPEAVDRIFGLIDKAVERFNSFDNKPGHVVLTFGGDQIEGYVSQGGNLLWRNSLTLTEMLRVSRRLTLHAVQSFAPLADRMTVAACASNHGQAVRLGGKVATRADDDFGIETLIAVSDACAANPGAYGHVEFVVPEDDSGVVVLSAAGSTIGLAHGHDWKPNQHWSWLSQSAMSRHPIGDSDILLAGHFHSLRVEEQSGRTFIQGPSCEKRSTWFRNATGMDGFPGVVTFRTASGRVHDLEVIR